MLAKRELEAFDAFRRDSEWFRAHYDELAKKYDGKFVAVKDRKVVDSDGDFELLLSRLLFHRFVPSQMLIEPVTTKPVDYILHAVPIIHR